MTTPNHSTTIEIEKLISGIGSIVRWRILVELAKGEPLPAEVLARRVRVSANAVSKHLLLLRKNGLLHRGYGKLYQIPKQFFVEGQRAIDFGAFILRVDYPDARTPKRARSSGTPG